jgi:Ku70/Ku80 beta-barrel domain
MQGDEVPSEDIGKGYKIDTDTYVEVSKEEPENVTLESARTIDITEFVPREQIDPRYIISILHRAQQQVGHDAFAVIRKTIREMNMVAIGRGAPRNLFRRFNLAESAAVPPVSGTTEFTRSPRAARGKLLRVHRDHQVLVGFAGVHDKGLCRVFDIQIARIRAEHLVCCAADDHHVRPGLDPMLVRVPFGGIMIARAGVTGQHENEANLVRRALIGLQSFAPFHGVLVIAFGRSVVADKARETVRSGLDGLR